MFSLESALPKKDSTFPIKWINLDNTYAVVGWSTSIELHSKHRSPPMAKTDNTPAKFPDQRPTSYNIIIFIVTLEIQYTLQFPYQGIKQIPTKAVPSNGNREIKKSIDSCIMNKWHQAS